MSIKINRIILNENEKNYSLAVFMYVGNQNPKDALDEAISTYVGDNEYYELVDDYLDNPWTRVIAKEIFENFVPENINIEGRAFDKYTLHNDGKTEVIYFNYSEGNDERPHPIMELAKTHFSKGRGYNAYIHSDLTDQWSRLMIFGINDMPQEVFKDQRI
jgi:hypothetical protein